MLDSSAIRLLIFFSLLLIMIGWEQLRPRRQFDSKPAPRYCRHLLLSAINTLLARLLLPIGLVGIATACNELQWGLFNRVELPVAVNIIIGLLLLDLLIYWQHRLFHRLPWLWRLHRLHHSDLEFDSSTALRFHPLEIIVSLLIKAAAIALLGIGAEVVLLFEIILNGVALFNHGNIRLPQNVDRFLRTVIVTPDMHRVHHSIELTESSSNFGFNLSCWDRVFNSYRANSRLGQLQMQFGLAGCRRQDQDGLIKLVLQPIKQFPQQENNQP